MLCLATVEPLVLQVRLPQAQLEGVPASVIAAAAPGDASTAEEVVISDNDDDDFQPGSDQKVAPRTGGQLCPVGGTVVSDDQQLTQEAVPGSSPTLLPYSSGEAVSLFQRYL